jgi:hypothetical protein
LAVLELSRIEGKLAEANAGRGKNRISHRRRKCGSSGLTHPAGSLQAVDNMSFDGRDLIDLQSSIGVKIALLHPAVLWGDLAVAA